MSLLTSTPLSTLSSDADLAGSTQLYGFLGDVLQEIRGVITKAQMDSYAALLSSLVENFLMKLPEPSEASWVSQTEAIKLTVRSIDIIHQVILKVEEFIETNSHLAQIILKGLFLLICTLNVWISDGHVRHLPDELGIDPPTLRKKAVHCVISIITKLSNPIKIALASRKHDDLHVRLILSEFVEAGKDLLSTPIEPPAPITLSLFSHTRMEIEKKGAKNTPTPILIIPDLSRRILTALTLNEIISLSLKEAPLIGELYPELPRRCLENVLTSCDLILLKPGTQRVQDERFQSLIETLERLSSQVKKGSDLPRVVLKRVINRHISETPFQPVLGLDSALVSCTRQILRLSSEAVAEDAGILAERGQIKLEPLLTLKNCLEHLRHQTRPTVPLSSEQVDASYTPQQAQWREDILKSLRCGYKEIKFNTYTEKEDHEWVVCLLKDIKSQLLPNLGNADPAMEQLASVIGLMPCLLSHPFETDKCSNTCLGQAFLQMVDLWLSVIHAMLLVSADITHSIDSTRTWRAFHKGLKHIHYNIFGKTISQSLGLIAQGLKSKQRSDRLAAGRCLAQLFMTIDPHDSQTVDQLFSCIRNMTTNLSHAIWETTIVTLANVARSPSRHAQERAFGLLISQLASENPLLRGLAVTKLNGLASARRKTPYGMLSPFLRTIALVVGSSSTGKTTILPELCRFLSISPVDFWTRAHTSVLSQFVSTRNLIALQNISDVLSTTPSHLLLQNSHVILPYLFLLQDTSSTDRAMRFFVEVLQSAAPSQERASINLAVVTKSCIIPLLADLVIALGAEDVNSQKQARLALVKVSHVLNGTRLVSSWEEIDHIAAALLDPYLLGVIAHVNDTLQDVYGRKILEEKKQVLRGLGSLLSVIGPAVGRVSPQVMATLQSMSNIPPLAGSAVETWLLFVKCLKDEDLSTIAGSVSAGVVACWQTLDQKGQEHALGIVSHLVDNTDSSSLDDLTDFSEIPELREPSMRLLQRRASRTTRESLAWLLERTMNDSTVVASQALKELKIFLDHHRDRFRQWASGDSFAPEVSNTIEVLFNAASRDGERQETLRLLAYSCLGCLGALDPDRLTLPNGGKQFMCKTNLSEESEAVSFALHLIKDLLVGTFRSTSDTKFQSYLAFAIQELLKFCGFSPDLISASPVSVSLKIRNRWSLIPKHLMDTIAPLLGSRYHVDPPTPGNLQHPIYPLQSTYREWLQIWSAHLITRVRGANAKKIFGALRAAVRNKDVTVANHIIPHLVLNILLGGEPEDASAIREEVVAVLNDQVNPSAISTREKRLLSAQVVFRLMDHLSSWMRAALESSNRKDSKRQRIIDIEQEDQMARVDSVLTSVDSGLVADAAFECKAYPRALMSLENHINLKRERKASERDLQPLYDRLHLIYCHLDEPDGMEGISVQVLEPSLEHQIRHHESMGSWMSAQSCWEVRLQEQPDKVGYHLGLLQCLRNLGHYDTLLTHISGALSNRPEWSGVLSDFHVEAAIMVGDWPRVQRVVDETESDSSASTAGRLLLAMKKHDQDDFYKALASGFLSLGRPITSSGRHSYKSSYESMVDLHVLHELKMFYEEWHKNTSRPNDSSSDNPLSTILKGRLDSVLPSFKTREIVLSYRRAAYATQGIEDYQKNIAEAWLDTAKIARRAKHTQTAYTAILHARQMKTPFAFVQFCKLTKETGEPLRALHELENALRPIRQKILNSEIRKGFNSAHTPAKALLLRAKWMFEADRCTPNEVLQSFVDVTKVAHDWESAHFHLGNYQDQRGIQNSYTPLNIIKAYGQALRHGSKYIFQTMPRLLTLWLDLGATEQILRVNGRTTNSENETTTKQIWVRIQEQIRNLIKDIPAWKWMTAFPQIVSRIGHENTEVVELLIRLMVRVIEEYPQQALWLFMSVVKSKRPERERRGRQILEIIKNTPGGNKGQASNLIDQCTAMTADFLELCELPVKDGDRQLSLSRHIPRLARLTPSKLIVPLQESLIVFLPPTSALRVSHQPFPHNAPTIKGFEEDIEIMKSLQRPRKITIQGSDGNLYMFLGKPKDDLRKDARLMDFNSIINKLLRNNSESRKRHLRIRTYGVVTLNEECGFIQWVPNTIPFRIILEALYERRSLSIWDTTISELFNRIRSADDKMAIDIFRNEVLGLYPAVFHEWFSAAFPEPSTWLASRLAYGRTAAVMSIVGFILGLGDRHCENILLDRHSGDIVHVDFNCLFEKGKRLETPERVPFRLTQNIVDGMGITGVEGVFRRACEITLDLLRENQQTLMSVLDAFIHDPLVEWEHEKQRNELKGKKSRKNKGYLGAEDGFNAVNPAVNLKSLALNALDPIRKKLQCLRGFIPGSGEMPGEINKEMSTSSTVEALIRDATDLTNLALAYPGWTPHL